MRLITLQDQDSDREFDLHFIIPATMETDTAVQIVDKAVLKVKENVDYTFEDLMDILTPLGFIAPLYVKANVCW